MSAVLVLVPEATTEFKEAAAWYNRQEAGLGGEFAADVNAILNAIITNPLRFGFATDDVREAPVGRFPYNIYYRLEAEQIVVISIFHHSRDPATWQNRS
jgi:plasmid stabilization system protein ParE